MARNSRYKYVYYYNRGTEELFDMHHDPQEQTNLLCAEGYPQDVHSRLKSVALEWEKKWGPEDMVVGDTFRVIPGEIQMMAMHGNVQFHIMDERTAEARGEQFIQECEYAIQTPWNGGKRLNEVFNEPRYIERFMKQWRPFGGDANARSRLFQQREDHE